MRIGRLSVGLWHRVKKDDQPYWLWKDWLSGYLRIDADCGCTIIHLGRLDMTYMRGECYDHLLLQENPED